MTPFLLRIESAFYSCLVVLFSRLPRQSIATISKVAQILLPLVGRKEEKQFAINVKEILGLPPHSEFARLFRKQVIRHQVTCARDTIRGIFKPEALKVTGFEALKEAVERAEERDQGLIVITAHLGSWELVAYFVRKASTRRFRVLAKPARRAALTRSLNKLRERMGVEVLWTDRKSILKDMLATLKAKEAVGFVMDQKPEGRIGHDVPFFKRPTAFVAGPAAMAKRTGASVIAAFCVRTGDQSFELVTREIVVNDQPSLDELALTAVLASEVERMIRLYPEQWTWSYRRWRFPPH